MACVAADTIPEGWFAWPSLEPITGSATDMSWMNQKPAGALGRITVKDGHFATGNGQRVRFWGVNFTSEDNFPDANSAESFARLLAKGGVNIARLHHMDNPWGSGSGGTIWPAERKEHLALDAAQLDKVHRLIAALKANGIYSNINLKVSKTLTEADGFPASISRLPEFQKRVDIYQRRMIDLQKDYARRILTAKNPYTGLSPVDDPAVAIIEMNNENSLLGYWTRDLGRGLDSFPSEFRNELAELWNNWLAQHYADDSALASAWFGDSERKRTVVADSAQNQFVVATRRGATLDLGADTKDASVTECAVANVNQGAEWYAQAGLLDIKIADGSAYTIEFQAKADQPRPVVVGVGLDSTKTPDESWRSMGLMESVDLDTGWKLIRLVFVAHSVGDSPARVAIGMGQQNGKVWIKSLRLIAGIERNKLPYGESLSTRSLSIPSEPSTRQWADWIAFLAHTERSMADEMRTFLRDELKARNPMVFSQVEYGGLIGVYREQAMEFADSHVYWQHPQFNGASGWDPSHWSIENTPQLIQFGPRSFGELGNLAMTRIAGKPYSVSEYDHPAPGEFVCEMYPEVSTFGARQDWDAIYPFCLGSYGSRDTDGAIKGYFDQQHHPAKWGQAVFATLVFRQGLVAPASLSAQLRLGQPLWGESWHGDVLWRKLIPSGPIGFLDTRLGVSDRSLGSGKVACLDRSGQTSPENISVITAAQGKVYVVSDEKAAAAVGFLGGSQVDAGSLKVSCDHFGRDFAAVTAVSLDSKTLRSSHRLLITVVGRAENQGMGWNAEHNSVGTQWGHGPVIVEMIPARLSIASDKTRTVYVLAPDGSRVRPTSAELKDGFLSFAVSPSDKTIHYEIVTE